jgi:hypothetical protein
MSGTPGPQKVPETLLPSRFTVPDRQFELAHVKCFEQIIIEKISLQAVQRTPTTLR